ncbi:acyl-CoA dehydrogenase NM domain-like protein [Pleurotus eryngii]|uniref:Acyl-CoA dehydrogenase NM domain-like protein n=1 Tax=Pleurotus eryngii TaxID=5323 RepID=A0A9P6DJV1_PLEER|nr:acyl-CoA dehydrogenase NM domain-like protein [Pleurotus eryngii]
MSLDGFTESQIQVREAIDSICCKYPNEYWAQKDMEGSYPSDLHRDLAAGGWLGICMPEKYGGSNLGISEATVMLQTIAESGAGIAGAQSIHANVYASTFFWTFATEDQRNRWLPPIISGSQRACFGVTEPNIGLDTLKLQTRATRQGDNYIVNGKKIWISSAQVAQKMVLLARTTPLDQLDNPSKGLSLFFPDIKEEDGVTPKKGVDLQRISKMGGRAIDANQAMLILRLFRQVFFDDFEIPVADRIGAEGEGFKQILHGMNAERCLLAGEALGIGLAALRRAARYASERVVFGRPIGQNQAIQHPLAQSWIDLEAAKLLTYSAAKAYDDHAAVKGSSNTDVGARCNAAKYFAAEVAFKACERAVMTHGGMGYSADFHVERYMREVFVPRIAPVSREMILNFISQKVLGLPKSY